jgi:sensor histidine kinase YesM
VPVPPLLLQPLVENAIRHGLEPKVDGGEIAIGARREGRRLVLEVCDTGVGLAIDPPGSTPRPDGGFGLSQVRERLATAYGEQDGLRLTAGPAGGTCATLQLPLSE